jgi:hypothetical protein
LPKLYGEWNLDYGVLWGIMGYNFGRFSPIFCEKTAVYVMKTLYAYIYAIRVKIANFLAKIFKITSP